MRKKLIVLDIDETLITSIIDFSNKNYKGSIKIRGNDTYSIFIFKRPGLAKFLNYIFKHYYVALWTAGIDAWLNIVLNKILKTYKKRFLFTWSREHTVSSKTHLKSIKKIISEYKKFNHDDIIFIDDNPTAIEPEFNNIHVQIKPYQAYTSDKALHKIISILTKNKNIDHHQLISLLNNDSVIKNNP